MPAATTPGAQVPPTPYEVTTLVGIESHWRAYGYAPTQAELERLETLPAAGSPGSGLRMCRMAVRESAARAQRTEGPGQAPGRDLARASAPGQPAPKRRAA